MDKEGREWKERKVIFLVITRHLKTGSTISKVHNPIKIEL